MMQKVKRAVVRYTALLSLALSMCAHASEYDIAAYVWPAYQPEPRWAELGIFKAGKGEWQNVWEAVPKWKGHRSIPRRCAGQGLPWRAEQREDEVLYHVGEP